MNTKNYPSSGPQQINKTITPDITTLISISNVTSILKTNTTITSTIIPSTTIVSTTTNTITATTPTTTTNWELLSLILLIPL